MHFICENKRINYDYYVVRKYELGLVLHGWEVKSIRLLTSIDLRNSFITRECDCFVVSGVMIEPTLFVTQKNSILLKRKIKLLLHKSEVLLFNVFLKTPGNTIIPSKVFWRGKHIKMEVALVKGKKKYEKKRLLLSEIILKENTL
jgi:SsrA-binding protein